jgi:CubicO group peptidase (beta-lactamase class C family)
MRMRNEPITTANWGIPPYNRQGFQMVQALFPTARIRRGAGEVTPFVCDIASLDGLSYAGLDGAPRTVRQMLDDSYTDSFLVAKQGVILVEEYSNNMEADSHHLMNSVSKSFIGMLIGIIADEGSLNVDQRVAEYVPELADTAFHDTTIRTALDMSAAVEFGEDYADPNADFWVETSVVGWRPALVKPDAPLTLFEFAQSLQATDQREGEAFHYRTVLTNVLGMVLERATQTSVPALLQHRLWSNLGPEQDACIVVDRDGFPYVGAGMNACTRDLARFGQMVLQQGYFNGQQIVPATWIDDTRFADDQTKSNFAASDYGDMFPGGHYRNQFWVSDAQRGVLVAIGIHGQTIHMNMSTETVIVKFSSHPESAAMEIFADTFAAMDAISETL